MGVTDKRLQREIDLSNLLKSDERVKWESEHVVCYGLYDDLGVESMFKLDEISVDSIDKLSSKLGMLSLRARYQNGRNARTYIVWLHKNSLYLLEKLLENRDFTRAKALLLKHGHKC
jgi:hypothetical protein